MRYTQHKRMINGDDGVKNGIFIPGGEKIWRNNGIREKSKKDPYNKSEERRLVILYWYIHISCRNVLTNPGVNRSQISRIGLTLKIETFKIQKRYDVSEFIGELLMIKVTPIGRRKRIDRKIKDERIIFRKRKISMSSGTATTLLFNMIVIEIEKAHNPVRDKIKNDSGTATTNLFQIRAKSFSFGQRIINGISSSKKRLRDMEEDLVIKSEDGVGLSFNASI
ncbi:hypothetical protein Tco_1131811 [Tanacetum coccineum]|uniref:Uncharacterized protein n=1 Tax=Tanacetum coccineum TaxID=301880 RepID=A0ABQ5JBI5_9ASTR